MTVALEFGITWGPRALGSHRAALLATARAAREKHADAVVFLVQGAGFGAVDELVSRLRARAGDRTDLEVPSLETFPAVFAAPLWVASETTFLDIAERASKIIASGGAPVVTVGRGHTYVFAFNAGEIGASS